MSYYKKPYYYRKRFYRYYGNRRFKQITSKYCYTKISMSFTVKNHIAENHNRYCLWQSNGQPLKNAQDQAMYPFDLNFGTVLGQSKGWVALASLYGKYKMRGVAVSAFPSVTQLASYVDQQNQSLVVLPWDGTVCLALTGNTSNDMATWGNVIENNKRLMLDPKSRVRSYWTIDDKSWHYTNQEGPQGKQDTGPPWRFVIGTSKSTNTNPPAGLYPDGAVCRYVFPEYFIDFTYYIMFYNQLM